VQLNPAAPASRPTALTVVAGDREAEVELDEQGRGELPDWPVTTMRIGVTSTEQAFQVFGPDFVPAPPGISELSVNGHRILARPRAALVHPCGSGPTIQVGGTVVQTAVRASVRDLVRGASVPFEPCQRTALPLAAGATDVVARPSPLFRAETLTLSRVGATSASVEPFGVRRDAAGLPLSASVPERDDTAVVVLPQNYNAGWVAKAGDVTLEPQRVDGWKQGWVLGPGAATTVTFRYQPAPLFTASLLGGAAGVLICLVCAALPGRRREQPSALAPGRVGLLDVVVTLVAGGLLAGTLGVAAFALAGLLGLAVRRRGVEWAPLAALAMVLVGVGLAWDRVNRADWANDWRQSFSLAAVACVVAALAGGRAAGRRRRARAGKVSG
jgi:arabinofuranan 3-O-arabinosyltransferase